MSKIDTPNACQLILQEHAGPSYHALKRAFKPLCLNPAWNDYTNKIIETITHQDRVAALVFETATALGVSEHSRTMAYFGAKYHDIGKLKLNPETLFINRRLSDREYTHVKEHADASYHILKNSKGGAIPDVGYIARIAREHHERLDGSGYPYQLTSDTISPEAKIVAVADVFDALTDHTRAYRPAKSWGRALDFLRKRSGTQFDATVVEALASVAGPKQPVPKSEHFATQRMIKTLSFH